MSELTKKECRRIELKPRKYRKNSKIIDNEFSIIAEFDTYKDVQIFRVFYAYVDKCLEVQRVYFRNEDMLIMEYGCWYGHCQYKYAFATNFDFRYTRHIHNYPDRIVIKSLLPMYKKYVRSSFNGDYVQLINYIARGEVNENVESLCSIDYKLFNKIWCSTYSSFEFNDYISKYIRCFQLITKWKYKLKMKEVRTYLDHLEIVDQLNLDLHSPKYIAPKNLYKAHQELVNRKQKKQDEIAIQKIYKDYQKEIIEYAERMACFASKEMNILISNNDGIINIVPLLNVKEIQKEGKMQHHCVFTNKYFRKKDTYIFTSYLNGKKLETIEYNSKEKRIVQARGNNNKLTDYHNLIVSQGTNIISKCLGY